MSDHTIPKDARIAFSLKRSDAKARGIGFEFTMEEWWIWWQTDDRWTRRGSRGPDQLVMARCGDVGPYSPSNVRCITATENLREAVETARIKRASGLIPKPTGRPPILKSGPMTKQQYQIRYLTKKKQQAIESNARRNEWGTPQAIIDAARLVMGEIDCDPATHAAAQERIQAVSYYTAESDGLNPDNHWHGRVLLNPPYERGLIEMFVIKLLMELAAKHTTEAIVLVNAQTDTRWFQYMMGAASACCFHTGRVRFLNSDGKRGMPLVGQALFYFNRDHGPEQFIEVFRRFGPIDVLTTRPKAGSPPPDRAPLRLAASAVPSGSPPRPNQKRPALRVAE